VKKVQQNTKKKNLKTAKKPRRRLKIKRSDAIWAFILAGALVAVSICISIVVINVHSKSKNIDVAAILKTEPEQPPDAEQQPSPLPEQSPSPELSPTSVKITPDATASPKPAVPVQPVSKPQTQPKPGANSVNPKPVTTEAEKPAVKPPQNLGSLVFMIDDAGNNLRELEPFLGISGPLTIAVLPGLPHSAEAARRIRTAGKEVFLHQPMEAIGAQAPGPGAIYSTMNTEEIRSVLKRNLAEVGPVAGINNHQGSKITMDNEMVETILAFCAEQGLLFLDSRTTAETAVPSVARNLGIKIGERDIFIDNEQNKESMNNYIKNGLAKAQKTGSAVMIGHTWSPELAPLLAEQIPLFIKQGYTIKTASDIIKTK